MAGANHGTDALEGFTGIGEREMVPAFASEEQSRFQFYLNGSPESPIDETPFGLGVDTNGAETVPPDDERRIAYFTVSIDTDRWIQPTSSAFVDGAGGFGVTIPNDVPAVEASPGNFLFKGQTNHDLLISNPAAIRLVLTILEAEEE
jgi:hypothetical protein